ncbi:formate dehydrogenase accessory sulfurtransferase FdhD [Zobellella sp. DQSA1]|uniref:formate dehydrogenase accessory sulfurtransferase FdhD n=1 Tax=Zobellella sp. DQSA1 TaxID=3342386 RepID=UPI0035C10BC7
MTVPVNPDCDIADINSAPPLPETFGYRELNDDGAAGSSALASETALAISYNGISQAVMMVTPGHLEDFVNGFSLSNDIVHSLNEIHDITLSESDGSRHAAVTLSNRAFWALKKYRRRLAGTSGCGICGVEAIEQALPRLTPLRPVPPPPAARLHDLRRHIREVQQLAQGSGALHAALYVDPEGVVRLCREDIGRHNALDKLIGAMAQARINPREGFVAITSRCGLELVQKAVRARFGTLISLSAPTAMTVQWARRHKLNLIHLPHRSPPRLYSPAP